MGNQRVRAERNRTEQAALNQRAKQVEVQPEPLLPSMMLQAAAADLPIRPRPADVLRLQQTVGNRTVQRFLAKVEPGRRGAMGNGLIIQRTPSPAPPEAHKEAVKQHEADRAKLRGVVEMGLKSSDLRLKNSCEWIKSGQAKLYALTKTPDVDSVARAEKAGKTGEDALFGYGGNNKDALGWERRATDIYSEPAATYNQDDIDENDQIIFDPPDSGGFRVPVGGKIFVTNPGRRDALNELRRQAKQGLFDPLEEVLKHEMQHESDVEFDEESDRLGRGSAPRPADIAWLEYKTEYRAYTAQEPKWLEKPPAGPEVFAEHRWEDGVQLEIFKQIYKGYQRTTSAWDSDAVLSDGRKFRAAVVDFRGPLDMIAANPNNSLRVKEFYDLVKYTTRYDDLDSSKVSELIVLIRKGMEAADRGSLWRNRFAKLALSRLMPSVGKLIELLLENPGYDYERYIREDPSMKKKKEQEAFESAEARYARLEKRAKEEVAKKGYESIPEDIAAELEDARRMIEMTSYAEHNDEDAWNNGLNYLIERLPVKKS